jgi:hypothetical protein
MGSGEHLPEEEKHDDSGLIVYGAMGVKRSKSNNFNLTSDSYLTKANGAMNADINQSVSFLTVPGSAPVNQSFLTVPEAVPMPAAPSAPSGLNVGLTDADKEMPYFSVPSPDILMAEEDVFRMDNGDVPLSNQFSPGAMNHEDQPTDSDSVSGLAATVAIAMTVQSRNSQPCLEEIVTADPGDIATDSVGQDNQEESGPVLQKRESKQSCELSVSNVQASVGDASRAGSKASFSSNPDEDE